MYSFKDEDEKRLMANFYAIYTGDYIPRRVYRVYMVGHNNVNGNDMLYVENYPNEKLDRADFKLCKNYFAEMKKENIPEAGGYLKNYRRKSFDNLEEKWETMLTSSKVVSVYMSAMDMLDVLTEDGTHYIVRLT